MTDPQLGQFERAVRVAVVQEGDTAFALEVRRTLEADSGKPVSRGRFYTTVERVKRKGLLPRSAGMGARDLVLLGSAEAGRALHAASSGRMEERAKEESTHGD